MLCGWIRRKAERAVCFHFDKIAFLVEKLGSNRKIPTIDEILKKSRKFSFRGKTDKSRIFSDVLLLKY